MSKKESVRIEMKRRSKVRTKEEQRKIAIFWRQTKKFVRIYTGRNRNSEEKEIKMQYGRAHDI